MPKETASVHASMAEATRENQEKAIPNRPLEERITKLETCIKEIIGVHLSSKYLPFKNFDQN